MTFHTPVANLPVSECIHPEPMNNVKGTSLKSNQSQKSFITIDDLARMAEELLDGIIRLSEYKYPLDVRKGETFIKEVIDMTGQSEESVTLKARGKTYFFDLRKTNEGKPYLGITESHLKKESKEPQRSTVFIFPEDALNFKKAFTDMIDKLG